MTLHIGRLAALGFGLAALAAAAPAHADTVSEVYSAPGMYTTFIPPYATSLDVTANGAGGTDGGNSSSNRAFGGPGGLGSEVRATLQLGPGSRFTPGDVLQVIVGARGGGGHGGSGNELAGSGGNGGGATVVTDLTVQAHTIVAAGGGGGGGGAGGAFDGYSGGRGGEGPDDRAQGFPGVGVGAGSGGGAGDFGCAALSKGGEGSSAGTATDAGGGGGGGDGLCGAPAGSAGGAGGGGAGGGGAGKSLISGYAFGTIGLNGHNGDGSAVLRFTRSDTAPQITSPASGTVASATGVVKLATNATGLPAPSFSLTGAPSWLSIDPATGTLSGTIPAHTVDRFTFTIHADNGVGTPATQDYTLNVTAPPVTLPVPKPIAGTVGTVLDVPLPASGGSGPYTWTVASGALPPGVNLTQDGVIAGVPTAAGSRTVTVRATDSAIPNAASATEPVTVTVAAGVPAPVKPKVQAAVYVVNGANSAVHSFALGATGNASPLTALAGSATGFNGTSGITIAEDGRTYVASANNNQIAEYAYGATGNVKPAAVIAGAATALASPQGLGLSGDGKLYVANAASSTITAYAPGASGNAKPVATIGGPHTGLAGPSAVTFDAAGHLWVANASANSLTEYAAGADGDAAPIGTIAGFATRLNGPQGIALDGSGYLVVADTYDNSVDEYLPTRTGNVQPIRRIAGSATGLSFPVGVDVDATGNLYVSNQFGGVESFLFPANGNRTPLTSISGPATGLAAPGRLAVAPPLSIATASLPAGRIGHAYRAALRADLGTTPYRWSVLRGRLPEGVRLRGNVLTGRPRRSETVHITVKVADASHPRMHATRRLALAIRR